MFCGGGLRPSSLPSCFCVDLLFLLLLFVASPLRVPLRVPLASLGPLAVFGLPAACPCRRVVLFLSLAPCPFCPCPSLLLSSGSPSSPCSFLSSLVLFSRPSVLFCSVPLWSLSASLLFPLCLCIFGVSLVLPLLWLRGLALPSLLCSCCCHVISVLQKNKSICSWTIHAFCTAVVPESAESADASAEQPVG